MHIFFYYLSRQNLQLPPPACCSAWGPRKLQAPSKGQLTKEERQVEGKDKALVAHSPAQEIDDYHGQQKMEWKGSTGSQRLQTEKRWWNTIIMFCVWLGQPNVSYSTGYGWGRCASFQGGRGWGAGHGVLRRAFHSIFIVSLLNTQLDWIQALA